MTLSARERTLALIVGGVVFLLFNLALLNAFSKRQTLLRAQLAARKNDWASMQQLLAERDLWTQRDNWLNEKQPKLANESTAGVQLLDQIRSLAHEQDVTIENPAIGAPAKTQWYRSVPVTVETRSTWPALIAFLQKVQAPEQFMVFESANIQIDAEDPSKMRGRFKIARWYAP